MARLNLILTILAVLCLAAWAGEAPEDTVWSKYVFKWLDSAAYHSETLSDGRHMVAIVVPPGAKPGDTLILADLIDIEASVIQMQQKAESLESQADSVAVLLEAVAKELLKRKEKKP